MEPNQKNMCMRCQNNETDLTKKLKTSMLIETCRGCERYLIPPKGWKQLAWGSQDLLIYLLNRNKSLKGVNIIDSNFIYTEEHSKRMSVEVAIVQDGIEQKCVLNYIIRNMQCPECMRTESQQYWKAIVQLRQKPHHKRTFLYIEQLILKHKAHMDTSNIKERKDGIDFYYLNRHDALKMVEFLSGYCGTEVQNSSRLISEDDSNNTANKKFSFSVEILPFCKDDIVYVGRNNTLGLGEFVLVSKVRSTVTFFDPQTLKSNKIYSKEYFSNRDKYQIVMRSSELKKFRVVYSRPIDRLFTEATITRDDINFYEVTTFLKLKDDDVVLGYYLDDLNLSTEINMNTNILLVRVFNMESKSFTLKTEKEIDDEFLYFIDDIAQDKEMLSNVCVFNEKDELIEDLNELKL
jgi:nonsense-mediated mRNA decay protein 3